MSQQIHTDPATRRRKLDLVQLAYTDFIPFLIDGMDFLGFPTSQLQIDMGRFIAYGPDRLMVQAQRGQAKTTIIALYAVWYLLHNPIGRVLIISHNNKLAKQISTAIVRIVMFWDIMECLRPDASMGDRTGVEAFDLHNSFKVVDKTASVTCVSIEAASTGYRASLLIADDIESPENSRTQEMLDLLMSRADDFTTKTVQGRIIWAGTPQVVNSIYNLLPERGYEVRIYPGRYPTVEEEESYGDRLAPYIKEKMEADPSLRSGGGLFGDRGQCTEQEFPGWLDEAVHVEREKAVVRGWYNLQYMLDTTVSDAMLHPIKVEHIILLDVTDKGPIEIVRSMNVADTVQREVHGYKFKLRLPMPTAPNIDIWQGICAYIDPAGGGKGGDETAYAISGFLNGTIYLLEVGGLLGGFSDGLFEDLATRIARWKPSIVKVEKNFTYGLFTQTLTPSILSRHQCKIEDDQVNQQKEVRIINTLAPIAARGSLVITPNALAVDYADCERYPQQIRKQYSFVYQIARITTKSGALKVDDRADATAGTCLHWETAVAQDQRHLVEERRQIAVLKFLENPRGKQIYELPDDDNVNMFDQLRIMR